MEQLLAGLGRVGLNHTGVVLRERFDEASPSGFRLADLAPTANSLLVVASGGPAFWNAFLAHSARHPGWDRRDQPLDDFTRLVVDAACAPLNGSVVFFPFFDFVPRLPFQRLGELAGLGRPSPLGLLVHPVFGPWFALRAAVALPFNLQGVSPSTDICKTCTAKPCITSCPGDAVTLGGWDSARCQAEREKGPPCASRCDARAACPFGALHRYPDDEVAFHHLRAFSHVIKLGTGR